MELTNSKRLLFTGSYVSSHLTPDERKRFSDSPGAGMRKANMLRALDIRPDRINALTEALQASNFRRLGDFETLVKMSRALASDRSILNTELATALAPISDETMLGFAKLTIDKKISAASKFLLDLYEHQQTISPIGRIYLERIEMFPVGVE